MIITLIGPMASGKTTVGQLLAAELKYPFVDTDHWIENVTSLSVSEIFSTQGEPSFRRWETQALEELLKNHHLVLATGGGIVTTQANRQLLQQTQVIYLQISLEEQLKRLKDDKTRPLLETQDKKATLTELQRTREPYYQQLAKVTINVDKLTPKVIATQIKNSLLLNIH